jgi:MoaA/NifB/PqqE/SkfB family radical SAM enzyme
VIALQHVLRVLDRKPWVAHLYVTEQCNLDCHYCNEYDNAIPHPAAADLQKWMDHIRSLGVVRIGFQGGEPLKHPGIAALVRYAKSIGFSAVSMSTNGFLLTRELLAELEEAGLDKLQISVDRMTPIASTRKSMRSILHKLDWFKESKVRLHVSGVLFKETLDEMGQVIDTCLDRGIPVHARVIHDDLVHGRALRDPDSSKPLLRFIEQQETLKRNGEKIHTSWNLFAYEKKMLRQETDRLDLRRGLQIFLCLLARKVLAVQSGANGAQHSRHHAGGPVELQPQEELSGRVWSLLHRRGLSGGEPSTAIRRPRSGGHAGKSRRAKTR